VQNYQREIAIETFQLFANLLSLTAGRSILKYVSGFWWVLLWIACSGMRLLSLITLLK
jgi:hypothetical protein